jgi:hypothetical protein
MYFIDKNKRLEEKIRKIKTTTDTMYNTGTMATDLFSLMINSPQNSIITITKLVLL